MKIKRADQVKVGEYVLLGNIFLEVESSYSSQTHYSCKDADAIAFILKGICEKYVFLLTDLLLVAEAAECEQ